MLELSRYCTESAGEPDGWGKLVSQQKTFYVYIVANEQRTIYIGMTNDLERRVWEHKQGRVRGFSARYRVNKLVYVESFEEARDAIAREKQLKGWRRSKKLDLVKTRNPDWVDLAAEWST
ncbi:GIY-YIG nuclease family protein [soil metagenome]